MKLQTQEEKQLQQLLQIECSIQKTYQNFQKLYQQKNYSNLHQEIKTYQNLAYKIEDYLLTQTLSTKTTLQLYRYVDNYIKNKSDLSDLVAICQEEKETMQWRRLRVKLKNKLQEDKNNYIYSYFTQPFIQENKEEKELVQEQTAYTFLYFINEYCQDEKLPNDIRQKLIAAKFNWTFIAKQEMIDKNQKISFSSLQHNTTYQRQKNILGMSLIDQQLKLLFNNSDQTIKKEQATCFSKMLLHQCLLRTGLLLANQQQVNQIQTDFQQLVQNKNYQDKKLALQMISNAFYQHKKDVKKVTTHDNPCLTK